MFKKKFKVSILDEKWTEIQRNLSLGFIPRIDEFILIGEIYFMVINIIYRLEPNEEIFVVVKKIDNQKLLD